MARARPFRWTRAGVRPLQQIDAANRYHVCGVTKADGSGRNTVWVGVAVGADHHLHRCFKTPGRAARQQALAAQAPRER